MENEEENPERENEEDKENLDDSRAETSMSNSTFAPPSGRIENEKAQVDSDGLLDLSKLNLTNLARHLEPEYGKVKHLDVSGNRFQSFAYMKMFGKCEILDARDCQINKFTSYFNENLKELYLSRNQLKQASCLGRFENLTVLDLSENQLEAPVSFSFKMLEVLDLSGNGLPAIPDLSKCPSIHSLNLSDNKISDLSAIHDLIPAANLAFFAVSSNSIDDLSQFSALSVFKKLANLFIVDNPCIEEVIDEGKFDYRPYIVACCSENLEKIDEEILEDSVRTEGEWLAIQGGIRKIGPGNHKLLCEQITSHFPKNEEGPPTPAQKSCHKALEKRKAAQQTDSDRTVNSVYSPFREWSGKMLLMNKSTMDAMSTPVKRRSHPEKQNLRMCSPPEARKNKSFTFRNESSSSTSSRDPPLACSQNYSRTNSTDTIILSSRTETGLSGEDGRSSEATPLPRAEDLPVADKEEDPAKPSGRTSSQHRSPSVADVSMIAEDHTNPNEDLAKRVKHLEQTVAELSIQNTNLTEINNGLVEMIEAFQKEQQRMWAAIHASIPKPQNLTSSLVTTEQEDDEDLQTHIVQWNLPLVQGYEIHVDGNSCGRVVGRNNSARITDLDPDKTHFVQIQAIGLNGERGELSKKLLIKRQ